MTILTFADKYRIKARMVCDEQIIQGKYGHIYSFDKHYFGCLYMPDPLSERPMHKKWLRRKRIMEENKFLIHVDCEGEGIGLFDPQDTVQAKVAITIVGARAKRTLSPEVKERLTKQLLKGRKTRRKKAGGC